MKRFQMALGLLSIASMTAFAGGPEIYVPPPPGIGGFYFGGGIGDSIQDIDIRTETEVTRQFINGVGACEAAALAPMSCDHFSQNSHFSPNNVMGQIFVGYGHTLWAGYTGPVSLYLAGEVGGDFTDFEGRERSEFFGTNTSTVVTNRTQVRLNSAEFYVQGRPGILVAPLTLVFGTIGASFNDYRFRSRTEISHFSVPDLDINRTRSVIGLRAGGGIEQFLPYNFSIRGEYVYTQYDRKHFEDSSLGVTRNVAETVSTSTSVRAHKSEVMVSVAYYIPWWV